MRISRAALLFFIGVLAAQSLYYFPNLPDLMASHFDAFGRPNGWMSKNTYFLFEFVLLVLMIGNFSLLPSIIGLLPDRFINIPNRNYWLAPERRIASFEKLKIHFEWFSVLLLTLFIAVNQIVFKANISKQNLSSEGIWAILLTFIALTVIWSVVLLSRFRLPRD